MCMLMVFDPEDDINTVVASNVSHRDVISPPDTITLAQDAMPAPAQMAIADSGATQIFIMEGTPPLKIKKIGVLDRSMLTHYI